MRLFLMLASVLAVAACRDPVASEVPPLGGSVVITGRVLTPDGQPAWGKWGSASAQLLSRPVGVGSAAIRPDSEGRFTVTLGPFEDLRSVHVRVGFSSPNLGTAPCQLGRDTVFDLGPTLLSEHPEPLVRDFILPSTGLVPGQLAVGTVCAWGTATDKWLGFTLQFEEVGEAIGGYWLIDDPSAIAASGTFTGSRDEGTVTLTLEQTGPAPWCTGGWVVQLPLDAEDRFGPATYEPTGDCHAFGMIVRFVEGAYWGPLPWP